MNHLPLRTPSSAAAQPFRRDSEAPLYQELARWLEQKVRSGEYPKGSRIPGDKQLAAELGVSVITVRAAMRTLRVQHLIERYPGKGTFVVESSDIRAVWGVGSADDLLAMGHHSSLKLLGKGYTRPPDSVAVKFGQPASKKVYWCQTLRNSDGEPFEFSDVYLAPVAGDAFAKIDLHAYLNKQRLVSSVVQDVCGLTISEVRQTLGAELAQNRVAKMLKVPKGTPIMTIERDQFLSDGTLVQTGTSYHRVDHFKYTTSFKRVASMKV